MSSPSLQSLRQKRCASNTISMGTQARRAVIEIESTWIKRFLWEPHFMFTRNPGSVPISPSSPSRPWKPTDNMSSDYLMDLGKPWIPKLLLTVHSVLSSDQQLAIDCVPQIPSVWRYLQKAPDSSARLIMFVLIMWSHDIANISLIPLILQHSQWWSPHCGVINSTTNPRGRKVYLKNLQTNR